MKKHKKVNLILWLLVFLNFPCFVWSQTNPHPLMRDFIGVNTRASDEILFMKKFNNLREYHGWDIAYDPNNITNCPVQKLMFNPGTDQSTLTNFDGFYGQMPRKVFPALKWLAPEMRGLMNYDQTTLEQKPWCVDGLSGIGLPTGNLSNEDRAAPFNFNTIKRNINAELISIGNRFFKSYASVTPSQDHNINVVFSFNQNCYGRYLKAWVDGDGDGDLENNEAIFTSAQLGSAPPFNGNVNFTLNLANAPTNRFLKMRIALLSNGSPSILEACSNTGLGGGPEVFIYDVILVNEQGTLIDINNYCDAGVVSSGFEKGFIQKVTITKTSNNTIIYEKSLQNTPASNYFNDGAIGRITQGIGYKLNLDDSPDTKSATVEIDANFDGDFNDPGETINIPPNGAILLPNDPMLTGVTAMRITHRNVTTQVTGIWEYPILVTAQGQNTTNNLSSPLLNGSPFALPIQANDPNDNGTPVFHKVSLPVEQEQAETYLDYAKWVTTVAGRYGANNVCAGSNNPYCSFLQSMVDPNDAGGASISGRKTLKYLEMGNEPEKYWYDSEFKNTDDAVWQMTPNQYATLLNAAYDGAANSPGFNFNNTGSYLGIKNIDPSMKVVMGALSEFRGGFIHDMTAKFSNIRATAARKVPFDVMNIHHYSGSTEPAGDYMNKCWGMGIYDFDGLTGGRGFCPEKAFLKDRYAAFITRLITDEPNAGIVQELKRMEYWLSEFGYSTNDNSPLKAKLDDGFTQSYFKTQAQWSVRSFLELSAMEVGTSDTEPKIVLNKAQIYEMRDYLPSTGPSGSNPIFNVGGDLFSHHGLLTQDFKPKKSWYYVQTTKNVLGNTRFKRDLNPKTDNTIFNYSQLQFDNGGDPPRVYYYRTDGGQRILAIWSPTANKSENKELKIEIGTDLFNRIKETNFDQNPQITQYTIIQIKDNSEYGFKSGHDVLVDGQNRYLVFNSTTVPISETPIFVLLGTKQSDNIINCPLTPEDDLKAEAFCTSALLTWKKTVPGSWRIFVAKKSDLPPQAACEGYKNTDLLGNQFVTTQTYNLGGNRTRFLLDNLMPNTEYVAFLLFVNGNRIPALDPCVVCFKTTQEGNCTFNPCLKVEPVAASGNCLFSPNDFCKIVTPDNGSNCFGTSGDPCTSGDPNASINCLSYTAPNFTDAMFQAANLWTGCAPYEVVVTFKDFVILDAIKFFHLQGLDHVAIYYSTCDCPDEKRYLTTFKPYNSYQRWVSINNNLPVLPIKKLYFKKISAYGGGKQANVVIGNLHFCGEEITECKLPKVGLQVDGPVRRGSFINVRAEATSDKEATLTWLPVNRYEAGGEFGTFNHYDLYIAPKQAGQLTQFDQSSPIRTYHQEGAEEVLADLEGLTQSTVYDALIRIPVPYPDPCAYPTVPSDPLKQSLAYGFPDNAIADTLITFVTKGASERSTETNKQQAKAEINIYPNPSTGIFFAQWTAQGYTNVEIWTPDGRLQQNISLPNQQRELMIDLSAVPPGLYIVLFKGVGIPAAQKKIVVTR
jgi:hypothetical protein